MTANFIHLRVHSEYSLVDGMVRIPQLVAAAAESGMPAVAVTDQSNLFAMVKFYRAALRQGIKPIIGVDVRVENEAPSNAPWRMTLLVQNADSYRGLCRLITRSFLEGQHRGVPMLQKEWIRDESEGLLALSGAREGDVGQALLAGSRDIAVERLNYWRDVFGDRYYLEIQRTGRDQEEYYLQEAVRLAGEFSVPVVATNDVCFLLRENYEAHEARVCVHEGRTLNDTRRPRHHSPQQYFRSAEEMAELFSDLPEALENSVQIARRCNLELTLGENFLPNFPVPEGLSMEDALVAESREGLTRRLGKMADSGAVVVDEKEYRDRLEHELGVINQMGFAGYFLIVADFIRWAKENDIPVGPGRGSGAGSLVAYALQITDIDPMRHELLFERFLNPERVSMPDFDIDFCMEGRDRVIEYVATKYGRERVSQIITYGSMKSRAAVRDVGRVLGHPYGFVDKIAKLIPFDLSMTLEKALAAEEDLRKRYEEEEEVHTLIDLARDLEGIARNAGKHAGGVVISPSVLTDFTPLYCEPGGNGVSTQYDKDDVETIGLVKFDFLGLRTLTIIDWAVKSINKSREKAGQPPIDITTLPDDDEDSYALLKRCETTAVFQLESHGMKELIKRLQPDCFDEIVALVALYRPGPLQSGMVEDFIDRKHGKANVVYPHPDLEPVLKPTYGVILYQEQVMQIAQILAGYTLGGADLLRRAMGKKKPEEMAKQRATFTEGAVERGVKEKTATYIFDLMEKFAGYGFNKSHSAAYALISYQTAWLKSHYPAQFMASVLSADMDNTDKVVALLDECRHMKLEVLPPDINRSQHAFTVDDENRIVYGLGAIKGVGYAAIDCVIEERGSSGEYQDLFDLCRRIDLRKSNRRVLEALIRAGALDRLGCNRATLIGHLPVALQSAEQHSSMQTTGQNDMFGIPARSSGDEDESGLDLEVMEDWDEEHRLQGEKDTLGLYLTGHPINRYKEELEAFTSGNIADLALAPAAGGNGLYEGGEKQVLVGGLVVAMRLMQSQRGGRLAFLTLDDRSGRLEVGVFGDTYQQYRDLLSKDNILVVQGTLGVDDYRGGYRLTAERIYDVNQAREAYAKRLVIRWETNGSSAGARFVQELRHSLEPFREGGCPVWIDYTANRSHARLPLGQEWQVHPTDILLQRLRKLAGTARVQVEY